MVLKGPHWKTDSICALEHWILARGPVAPCAAPVCYQQEVTLHYRLKHEVDKQMEAAAIANRWSGAWAMAEQRRWRFCCIGKRSSGASQCFAEGWRICFAPGIFVDMWAE